MFMTLRVIGGYDDGDDNEVCASERIVGIII